ncbi:unnamed protein product [Calicophoron daubneyi]|uniref:Secreted protein n=1 Tax=Calicophoron daubneyi TaxID=300641 RepID=A0AAV2TXH0_CALDB
MNRLLKFLFVLFFSTNPGRIHGAKVCSEMDAVQETHGFVQPYQIAAGCQFKINLRSHCTLSAVVLGTKIGLLEKPSVVSGS